MYAVVTDASWLGHEVNVLKPAILGAGHQRLVDLHRQIDRPTFRSTFKALAGFTYENTDFGLSRGGVIIGRVADDRGEPVANALMSVRLFRFSRQIQELIVAGSGTQITDEIGAFRIVDLPPDDYYVSAAIRPGRQEDSLLEGRGHAVTFFPSTTNLADARRITVGVGTSIEHVNITLIPVALAAISGTVADSAGQLLQGGEVFASEIKLTTMTTPRGTHSPRRHVHDRRGRARRLRAFMETCRVFRGETSMASRCCASACPAATLKDLRLAFVQPSTASGRIIADPAAVDALRRSYTGVMMNPTEPQAPGWGPGLINADLTFAAKVAPGGHVVRLSDNRSGVVPEGCSRQR